MFAGLQFALFLLVTVWGCGLTSGNGYKNIPAPSTFEITSPSLPAAPVSQPYSYTLTAAGGKAPLTWSTVSGSGSLPPGLSLSASTGAITGTPTASSAYTFTVQASDGSSPAQTTRMPAMIITVPLDQYGGRTDVLCTNTTGHFILSKVNNRWWFCTPAGHGFTSMDVAINQLSKGAYDSFDCNNANVYPIYTTKYGDASFNWAWQQLNRASSWGFNAVGAESIGNVTQRTTCSNCVWPGGVNPVPKPWVLDVHTSLYASANAKGNLDQPIKDEIYGVDNQAPLGHFFSANFDIFDPREYKEIQGELANTSDPAMQALVHNNPWIIGLLTDDSDWFMTGSGPDFVNVAPNANQGLLAMVTSPVQTIGVGVSFNNGTFLYSNDTLVYVKAQATNPVTQCSAQSPCSLRDYLWQKYAGNISALNTAWGSNYTTFDSSGTQVMGELIATGNGSTTTFTHTLAHASVSPFSLLVSVGSTPQIGDYPWFKQNPAGTSNTGQLLSPTSNYVKNSSINYSTGAISITFGSAPANGAAITVNYVYGGWMAGGTGLMDESGTQSHSWIGTNAYCLEGPDPSFSTYFLCTGGNNPYKPVPNANPNFGADIDNWIPEFMAKYAKNFHDGLRAAGSNIPYWGIDSIGGWGAPPYSKMLEGEAAYADVIWTELYWHTPSSINSPTFAGSTPSPEFAPAYQYLTKYSSDLPIEDLFELSAEADSGESCHSKNNILNFPNQTVRGQMYYNTVNYLLTTPGFNGDIPFVGSDWFPWQDFQNNNLGLVSSHDNAYDGHEATTAVVHCSAPLQAYTCGADTGNYGDVITQIRAANMLWLIY